MIKVDNIEVMNFEGAFRGLRNPMNSWSKSDSSHCLMNSDIDCPNCPIGERSCKTMNYDTGGFIIGSNDMNLAQRMIKAGDSDSKFLRQIFVSMDIDAPILWWKEMDQYKVGTVTNSCSTMHKLASTPITKECFSFDETDDTMIIEAQETIVNNCEALRQRYNETKDVNIWRALIQLLPESWNQKRTWTANYAILRNLYFQRKNHRLIEWREFCEMIESLPYGKELITYKPEEVK